MPVSTLSTAEHALLSGLIARNVPFMIVGMSGALLQGARGVTEDIDLWFEDVTDPRIAEAVLRFDVVTSMTGLEAFAKEASHLRYEEVDGLRLLVLALPRIVVSKTAANRDKDRAVLPSLLDALAALGEDAK